MEIHCASLTRLAALGTLSRGAGEGRKACTVSKLLSRIALGLSGELNSIARLASRSTKIMPADTSPSPPFRGEREGPDPQGWEGEVGGATNRLVGPPHPTLSPGQRGERVKNASSEPRFGGVSSNSRSLHFPRTALRTAGEGGTKPAGLGG